MDSTSSVISLSLEIKDHMVISFVRMLRKLVFLLPHSSQSFPDHPQAQAQLRSSSDQIELPVQSEGVNWMTLSSWGALLHASVKLSSKADFILTWSSSGLFSQFISCVFSAVEKTERDWQRLSHTFHDFNTAQGQSSGGGGASRE